MKKLLAFLFLCSISGSLLAQVDTVPPVLVCNNNLAVNLLATCAVSIWATDLIDLSLPNNEYNFLQFGIRRRCTGSGFPENTYSLSFYACDLGLQPMEVWARDTAGNTSSCHVNVIIQSPAGNCDPFNYLTTNTPSGNGILHTKVDVLGISDCFMDTIAMEYSTLAFPGPFSLGAGFQYNCFFTPPGYTTSVTPSKTINPTNGITTYDLVLISKHILGIEPLDSPYKLIAADANLDGQVTTSDIVLLRKLILGIIPEFPHKQSWRFVVKDYVFPNPANPFNPPFPESFVVPFTDDTGNYSIHFIGVKIGDVNNTAIPEN